MPPEHYESGASRARVERIRAGALDKSRARARGRGPRGGATMPAAVLGVLRDGLPVLLLRSASARGDSARSWPPAPSCSSAARACAPGRSRWPAHARSADPAVDDHLGEQLLRSAKDREEQAIVTRRIVRALAPASVWVTAADEPVSRDGEHPAPRPRRSAPSSPSPWRVELAGCCTRRPRSAASRSRRARR
jgi:salicylate biosynthesis isochorismate synthase/menaquinone-specific isochorismate synthase